MRGASIDSFGGKAGNVLGGALSGRAVVSGLGLGLLIAAAGAVCMRAGGQRLAAPVLHGLVAVVLARQALRGRRGPGSGADSAGGGWRQVGPVAVRYAVLSLALWVPVLLAPAVETLAGDLAAVLGGGSAARPELLLLWLPVPVLSPPLLLILAVSARRAVDLVSVAHWRRLFAGRGPDLLSVYAIYLGAVTLGLVVLLTLLGVALAGGSGAGRLIAWACLAALLGVTLDLLGRLCGAFVLAGEPAGDTAVATSADDPPGAGRPPLEDAATAVQAARSRFVTDPEGALHELERVRARHAPDPRVLHALCELLHRHGRVEAALQTAEQAFPLALESGRTGLAARTFAALQPPPERLGLDDRQLVALAHGLVREEQPRLAATIFAHVLRRSPGETRAVAGLLQVADARLRDHDAPADAAKIYRFLLSRCGDSPLAESVRDGLAAAERRLPAG